ncbi:MAG: response regulator [Acidobacteria bacterium]|nr:response regulator [Acidobacteriota bacterium]
MTSRHTDEGDLSSPSLERTSEQAPAPVTILVVDDDENILRLVRQTLELGLGDRACRVVEAADGLQGLEAARREQPDLVVSDIMMPGMTGLEFCRAFRELDDFKDTPFLFLSALGTTHDKITGLRSGADDYLVKPFDPEELIVRLEVMCRKIARRPKGDILRGSLHEIPLADILQFLDYTMRRGTLHVSSAEGAGTLAVKSPLLLDAAYGDLQGEDALLEMLTLRDGCFQFIPGPVSTGRISKPISFILMDSLRLYDEHQFVKEHLPDNLEDLRLNSLPQKMDDPDVLSVIGAIRNGKSSIPEIQDATRLSQSRVIVSVAKLAKHGHIGPRTVDEILCIPARPLRVLFAFTREDVAAGLFREMAAICGAETPRAASSGVMGFLKISLGDRTLHLLSIKGEKRFSFLWEPMLRTTDAAVFLAASPQDEPHLQAFREQACRGRTIPFFAVSPADIACDFAERIDSPGKIQAFLRKVVNHALQGQGNPSSAIEDPTGPPIPTLDPLSGM